MNPLKKKHRDYKSRLQKKKHRDYKSLLQGAQILLTLAVAIGVLLSSAPTTDGFIASDHRLPEHFKRKLNSLIRRVHKEQWVIGYAYADERWGRVGVCPPEARNNGPAIEAAITQALNAWLQPVKDLNTGKPVVDDFRFVRNLDPKNKAENRLNDLVITFYCEPGKSTALVGVDMAIPPSLVIRRGTDVDPRFSFVILHEMGHAFGLLDTYQRDWIGAEGELVNRGGLARTIGHQPASVMSGINAPHTSVPDWVSQDDANGIVWLYKFYHENLSLEDCIFPDYELEESPVGCRPKSPLLFEIKHGNESIALLVLDDDEKTDVTARDAHGSTALHYAAMKGYPKLMEKLLWHKDIEVNAKDAEGSTALFWAATRGSYGAAERLVKHKSVDVNIRGAGGNTPLKEAETQKHKDIVALLLEQAQNEDAWREIDATSIANYRSVFYLLVPDPDTPLLFHVGYLGTVLGGDALFVAQKQAEDGIEKFLDGDDISLIGYDGLVAEAVNVREVASFRGGNGETGSVLLAIRDVDFSAYAPLALSLYSNLRETDVELLTYKFGSGIVLEGEGDALALPLRVRGCVSVPHAGLGAVDLYQHTCGPANSVSDGSILFHEKTGTILGFYRSQESDEILGDGLPLADVVSEALIRLVDAKPVSPKNRLTTTWAEIKMKQ